MPLAPVRQQPCGGARNSSYSWSEDISCSTCLKRGVFEQSQDLFEGHANTVIRGKIESDGWPSLQVAEDPELRAAHVHKYLHEGLGVKSGMYRKNFLSSHPL